jgi:hypothetical protein
MSTTRTQFTFRVDTWTPDGESIVEHVASRQLAEALLAPRKVPMRVPENPFSCSGGAIVLVNDTELLRLFLRICHVRKIERLASFRQRDPRIPQACIMFAWGLSASCASVAHLDEVIE